MNPTNLNDPADPSRGGLSVLFPSRSVLRWRSIPSRIVAVAAGVLLSATTLCGSAFAAPPNHEISAEGPWVKGRVLVMPRAGLSDKELAKIVGAHGGRSTRKIGNQGINVIELPQGASEKAVAKLLAKHPNLKFAEPDELVAPDMTANDSYFGSAWHLQAVAAPFAWDISLGDGITVAVLDTGVNANHPDLQGKLVPGWNLYDNNSNTADVYGHGTMVAGVVAALSNNSFGVASIAWNAKVMPIRISAANGLASLSTIASALYWAADHGAKVANISYQVQSSATVQAAARYMQGKGGLVVTSAGNTGTLDATPPSDALISVSATGSNDARASWSTYGPYVDVSAPGVGIWTTTASGGYSAPSGTSFSSPLTAGVIALMMAANPALAPAQLESLLKSTAYDLGSAGYDQYYGEGRVNAASAVEAAAQAGAADTQAPTLAIASPTGGTVSGLVPVDVSATDDTAVTQVELLANGTLVGTDTVAPYSFSWDSTNAADGGSVLLARAYDAAGNAANSAAVDVTVANDPPTPTADTTAPTVKITSPADGSRVSKAVTIKAAGSDNVAVASMSLYVDGVMLGTGNVATISVKWDPRKAAKGLHTISAVATDTSGNQASTTITVTK